MAGLHKRGKSWYLSWREGGKLHRRSLGPIPRIEAERIRKINEGELASGKRIGYRPMSLAEFAGQYLTWHEQHYPDSHFRVRQIIKQHIIPRLDVGLEELSPFEIESWKMHRLKLNGAKPETVNKELRTLKAMLNQAVAWDVLESNPAKEVKSIKSTRSDAPPFYSVEQLQELYAFSIHHHWIWRLMVNTGVRRGEALALRRAHVIGDKLRIVSTSESRTKSGQWREVPLNDQAQEAIKHLGADYLVPRMHPKSLSRAFTNCARRAELPGSIHWLRHTFCSHLVMANVPLRVVQVLAGHASYRTTERYAHLSPDYLAGATASIGL